MMKKGLSELPTGGPLQRGVGVDPGLPGTMTYTKPVDDVGTEGVDDEAIYEVEDANDLTKYHPQVEERDRINIKRPSFYEGYPSEGTGKTDYPYRYDFPNRHSFEALDEKKSIRHSRVLTSAVLDTIYDRLNPLFKERARRCTVTLRRVDLNNLRWIFGVDAGNGVKIVKMRILRDFRKSKVRLMDLELSCSCPGWIWLGPEYHAVQESYLLGNPIGTATPPNIRDPQRHNRVCKHVAAVLKYIEEWSLPKRKRK